MANTALMQHLLHACSHTRRKARWQTKAGSWGLTVTCDACKQHCNNKRTELMLWHLTSVRALSSEPAGHYALVLGNYSKCLKSLQETKEASIRGFRVPVEVRRFATQAPRRLALHPRENHGDVSAARKGDACKIALFRYGGDEDAHGGLHYITLQSKGPINILRDVRRIRNNSKQ
jgi:hypothetical protein